MRRFAPVCAAFWLLLLAAPRTAAAQSDAQRTAARAQQLGHYADQLLASDAALRSGAVQVLGHLGIDFLPALLVRLTSPGSPRPSHEEVLRSFHALRRAAGAHRVEDEVDMAHGIEAVLQRERSRTLGAVVESLLYLRALEAMDDERAQLALAHFASLDDGAWDNELRLLRKRCGVRLLPTLIIWRTHDNPALRRFAVNQIEALGMTDPALALAIADPQLLSRLIRAYVSPPDYAAMPLIVRLVNAPRIQVRDAARFAVARYAKNAIWQLRELYEEHSGQPANKAWDAERTARELYAVVDRAQQEDAETLLARGLGSLLANDLRGVRQNYDLLLAKYPWFEERAKLAPGYAAMGGDALAHDDLLAALAAYRRALWLDPNAQKARSWRAQIEYASAELMLTQGVVDLSGYDRALRLDPSLLAARRERDVLSGEQSRRTHDRKRLAAGGSLLLFATLSVLLLRSGRRSKEALVLPPEAA